MAPNVDPAIIEALGLGPNNTKIASHGGSGFASTFKLSSSVDGKEKNYFVKTGSGADSKIMFRGEHASLNAIHNAVPNFCPASHAHGEMKSSPGKFFLATDFLDLSSSATGGSGLSLAAKLAKLHTTPAPIPEGHDKPMFGFPVTTCCGKTEQDNSWKESWAEFYAESRLRGILCSCLKSNGQDSELEKTVEKVASTVVPRLIGDDRMKGIVPVVIHGDLWSGNHGRGQIAGRADVTGPVVEIEFAGYADLAQTGTGLRQRLYSRAFIFGDVSNPDDRFVYLVLDTQSGDVALRYGILDGLAALGSDYAVYGQSNVAVSGTHSHSGPGAWFNYLLPQITSLGWDEQSYQAIVTGAVLSIQRAHESLTPGYLDVGTVQVADANIQRSEYAYMANPADERALYSDTTDKTLTMLRFQRASDLKNIGVLSWYPVHGTSMLGNNTHASGDNKGVAAYLFERSVLTDDTAADGFVAGFSQANVGDTTPNTLGAYCDDGSGDMCTYENSTCADGKSQSCHGRGPEFAKVDLGVSSCYEIGRRQFQGAKDLYDSLDSTGTPVVGTSVKSFHFYQNMSYFQFALDNGTTVQTCPAALGNSFAAGTTDWPGAFDFTQGDSGAPNNPFWNAVAGLLHVPGPEQIKCQWPKPVLLDVGETDVPYAWAPDIVDVMSMRVGQVIVIASPSEVTTMAGRRWRNAVSAEAASTFSTDAEPIVVLGSPANTYAHYVATQEEYGIQRYEGASTLYGQHELNAYINLTLSNLAYLAPTATSAPAPGSSPPDNRDVSLSFITGVVLDAAPLGSNFGDCTTQPSASYTIGAVVNATFVGANPRNNLRLEGTFAAVEQLQADGTTWTQVRDDYDWFLVYTWERTNSALGYSDVVISWETESYAEPGTYRIHYYGDAKPLIGSISAFEGISDSFTLA